MQLMAPNEPAGRPRWASEGNFDAPAVLSEYAKGGDLDRMLAAARPPLVPYERLRQQLQRYRALQAVRFDPRSLLPVT